MTSYSLLNAQLRTVHVRIALRPVLESSRGLGKNEYVRHPNTIIVANNRYIYITVKSLRSELMSILLWRVRVSVPFHSTLANHHAAAEIEVSAGK